MEIAVDAKWYHVGPAGARTYTRNLLDTLREIDERHRYHVFVRSDDPVPESLGDNPRWRVERLRPNVSAPRVWWGLPWAMRGRPVDLFFTQSLVPRTRRAPRVVTVHDVLWHDYPEHFTWKERLHFGLIDRAVRSADLIMTDSEHSRERICATGGRRPEEVVVIPLGVSPRFQPVTSASELERVRGKWDLPEEFILYVGRINRRKNLETLFGALARLPREWTLVCAGARDWKQGEIDRSLGSLSVRDRVRFLGPVADEDLPGLYSLATVFAYIPFAEGFGIPPLEAMACGTPAVVSNTTSIPEVVGDAGVTVGPTEVEAVAGALRDLLEDGGRRAELRGRGLERAGRYTWRGTAEKVLEIWGRFA
jgi:glycosyltransferase involved in cell wall biosynthesis